MNAEPVWIALPTGDRQVNVIPLLSALEEFDRSDGAPLFSAAIEVIERTLYVLNLTAHDPQVNPPDRVASLYSELHRLLAAFKQVEEKTA